MVDDVLKYTNDPNNSTLIAMVFGVVVVVALIVIIKSRLEGLENTDATTSASATTSATTSIPVTTQPQPLQAPSLAQGTTDITVADKPITASDQQKYIDSIVAGPTKLTTADLLPKYDDANSFAKENPVSKLLKEQNFLISGYHVGINTVMQSNKIPYLDIRSLPPIPKEDVGPWNKSSFEQSPAALRKSFEIGV